LEVSDELKARNQRAKQEIADARWVLLFAPRIAGYCDEKLGYEVDHQTGRHIILRHPQMRRLTGSRLRLTELRPGSFKLAPIRAGASLT
jgi:hypothetical protein